MIEPGFRDPLVLEELGPSTWRLVRELRYDSAVLGARVIVPTGYISDLSSVPRLPFAYWLAGDTARKAGLVHDFLYDHRLGGRQVADDVFREAMAVEGVPRWRAWLMYLGVRWRGESHW